MTAAIIPIVDASSHCGTCTMCCKLMGITELDKPAGTWCQRVEVGVGCGAYADRPQSCADFECVWLQSQHSRHGEAPLPAALRPDRSHVVIDITTDGRRMVMHVDPARPDAHTHGPVARIVDRAVRRGEVVAVVIGDRRRLIGTPAAVRALTDAAKEKQI